MKKILIALIAVFPCLILAQESAGLADTTKSDTTQAAAPAPAGNEAILQSAEAQQVAATTEAGKYERKSVSFINALWLMDKSVRDMPGEYVGYTLDKIKEKIMMPRFDYNPLPDAMISDFVAQANAKEELTIDNIAELMDQTIVPKILAIVDLNKEMRGEAYASEAQKNSFYATKAKEFGFTDVELAKIMNSAFIFIPIAKSYSGVTANGQYTMKMDVGILWYRISTKGEKAQAKLVVKKITTSMGFAKEKASALNKNPKEFAYHSCVKNAARNLLNATQEMPEFRLSGQAVEVDGGNVGFDLGYKEGIRVDDKYQIVEFEENADGSIKQTNSGWVTVTKVADSNSTVGYKSMSKVVKGDPMTGAVLSEYPRIPIDIALDFRTFPGDGDTSGSGIHIDARYNLGRVLKFPQLYAGVGYGFGNGDKVSFGVLDITVLQRMYIKALTIGAEVGFSIQTTTKTVSVFGIDVDTDYSSSGLFLGGNFGYAFTPAWALDLTVRYDMGGGDVDYTGMSFGVGVLFSPPSLPFDPIDMIKARMGIGM
ncbi:MAG: porin family protein [Chitinispirillaceae bacterium]|jgi:hypothetical protein|nr:porin family protein [Chitinispirillaceae bacterium]